MAAGEEFRERVPRECLEDWHFIASGGFGTIYRARHRDWRIPIAVKKLSRDTCSREELLAEARAMDKARFIYILRLFGLYEEEEEGWAGGPRLGIVMEYMECGSLSGLLERVRPVPWALRFRLVHQVALGMNYLHGLCPPLLHLDLKPSNVLLNPELDVRLADFGLSKFKRGTTKQRADQSGEDDDYGGTLEYMPPESFINLNYRPTPATDVYSYGILTWSVLTGEQPYPYLLSKYMSSLLRLHVPRGQRPELKPLEEVTGVEGLEAMKELMKRCWDNESQQRPSFKECSDQTETIVSCHKSQIVPAVRQVQDVLMKMASSPSHESQPPINIPTPPAAESSDPHPSPPSSMGLSEQFKTLCFEELPSRGNGERVPILDRLPQAPAGDVRDVEGGCSEAVPQRDPTQTEHRRGPGTPRPSCVNAGPLQGAYGLHQGEYGPPKPASSQDRPIDHQSKPFPPTQTHPNFPASGSDQPMFSWQQPSAYGFYPGANISIIGPSSGVQIGHNNYMKVSHVPMQKPKKKKKK